LGRLDGLVQIGDEVVDVFDADRQADEIFRHARRDLFFGRELLMRGRCRMNHQRLGITNTVISNCRGEFLSPAVRFDRVLVDAPCSGEGRYRIYADGRVSHRRQGSTDLTAIQKGLLLKAFDLVKEGGILVYSTCSLNPRENEEVVNHLLKKRHARVEKWHPTLPWHAGLSHWQGKDYNVEIEHCRRFYPHEIDSVGFFVARIRKP